MDTIAPGIECEETQQIYPLTAMSAVMIMKYATGNVADAFVRVLCPCGRMHFLPLGHMVEEAEALGFPSYSEGCPPIELVLAGSVGLPVLNDPMRLLSPSDEARIEQFGSDLETGSQLEAFRLESDERLDAESQAAALAFWPEFWRWLYSI